MHNDTEKFQRQYLPLHPKLYRIAFVLTGNSQDAEDILQDAYCKLWNRRTELEKVQNPEAFCVTMVKNLCYDMLRSPKRAPKGQPHDTAQSPDGCPEAAIAAGDAENLIRALIDRLPPNQRQVLQLRGLGGCSIEEIEEITGLSAVNIRVLLSRARKLIREQYDKLTDHGQ